MRFKVWFAGLVLIGAVTLTFTPITHGQQKVRLNRIIALLEQNKTVFGAFAKNTKSTDSATQMSNAKDVDWVFYNMEHSSYNIDEMRTYMQFMLDPAAIVKKGSVANDHPILVNLPTNGREMNQWMIKQVLDQGAFGIITPHTETAQQVVNIVRSMRYLQPVGAPDFEPEGQRGWGPGGAIRYWGVSQKEYQEKADLWPLDPNGELVSLFMIENQLGVKNIRDIARQKGVTIIGPAPGDLLLSYGNDPAKLEEAIQTILAAGKEFNVPVACLHCFEEGTVHNAEQRIKQGFRVMLGTDEAYLTNARKLAGR